MAREPIVSIAVSRDYLTFSAAHFAQLGDGSSERLHGHNYTARIRLVGPLDGNEFVADFSLLKSALRELTSLLNHRVLVPGRSSRVAVTVSGDTCVVTADGKRYSIPTEDAVVLPVANTTVEALALYLVEQLGAELRQRLPDQARLYLRIEESPGQGAEASLDGDVTHGR